MSDIMTSETATETVTETPIPTSRLTIIKDIVRYESTVEGKVLLPFVAILLVVGWFHEFVKNAVMANVAINGLIIAAALYGVVLILARLMSAQVDHYTIKRFGRQAMEGVYMPRLLEENWLKSRDVRHFLKHIAQTGGTLASSLQQNAIENELRTLAADFEHKLELPQFIVGFMIAMGLLGTFIGLLETLTGISGMLDGFGATGTSMDEQFMKLVVELRKPLAGMGIAFSASMFGLVTSLMLAIMMINLRRYIGHVVNSARNVMHDLTELARGGGPGGVGGAGGTNQLSVEAVAALLGPKGKMAAGSIAAEGDSSLQDLVYQVNDTSLMVANRMDGLTQKIESFLHLFESNVKLTQKQNDLLGVMPRIAEGSDRMVNELKEIGLGQGEQRRNAQLMTDASVNTARAAADSVLAQRQMQDEMATVLRSLADRMGNIERYASAFSTNFNDVKENFTNLGNYTVVADTISNSLGRQTLLLETIVKEDRNLQKRLVSIQQDIREKLELGGTKEPELPPDFIP